VDPKGPAELVKEFCDLNYWDIGTKACDIDVDALYAELDEWEISGPQASVNLSIKPIIIYEQVWMDCTYSDSLFPYLMS